MHAEYMPLCLCACLGAGNISIPHKALSLQKQNPIASDSHQTEVVPLIVKEKASNKLISLSNE